MFYQCAHHGHACAPLMKLREELSRSVRGSPDHLNGNAVLSALRACYCVAAALSMRRPRGVYIHSGKPQDFLVGVASRDDIHWSGRLSACSMDGDTQLISGAVFKETAAH
jgi:hypothetical protein